MKTSNESLGVKKTRAAKIVKILKEEFPEAKTALTHENPFELLIATILSAQCTDVRVNLVTPKLFEAAPTPEKMKALGQKRIEALISSINFFRTKAKNIHLCAEKLVRNFKSQVPQSLDELITLPGVGRKTANVVLGAAFNISGVVVDTHVLRLSNRLRFTSSIKPAGVEKDLENVIDRKEWVGLSTSSFFMAEKLVWQGILSASIAPLEAFAPPMLRRQMHGRPSREI